MLTLPELDLEVLRRLCSDPLLTADEAAGRVGPVFVPDVWRDDEDDLPRFTHAIYDRNELERIPESIQTP